MSLEAKEVALQEAEKLRSEVQFLTRKLVELKEREMERMDEINKMHEEMVIAEDGVFVAWSTVTHWDAVESCCSLLLLYVSRQLTPCGLSFTGSSVRT